MALTGAVVHRRAGGVGVVPEVLDEGLGRRPAHALADDAAVDLDGGDDLGAGAGQEDFVGAVQVVAREVALDDLGAEVLLDELHDDVARHADEDAGGGRRREDLALLDVEEVVA